MQNNSYQVLSYKIKHSYDVSRFLEDYSRLLQRTIDLIWNYAKWIEKNERRVPIFDKSNDFKKWLRRKLLEGWSYAKHYVDSAIRTVYSILKSWRKNYVKGRRKRRKLIVKNKFIRVKETLYTFKDWILRITIIPREKYLTFDLKTAWFRKRIEGLHLGELILKKNELIITVRKPVNVTKPTLRIGWDSNLFSLDGFSPKLGWIKIDLSRLFHIHRVHEEKRKKAQEKASHKLSIKKTLFKHGEREKNRSKALVHEIVNKITRTFPNALHGFEDLSKEGMYNKSRKHNRDVSKQNWKEIIDVMSYKANVKLVDPRNTSSTCPRCGERMKKLQEGQVVKCKKCGLKLNRQLCGAINVYLKMCGFPQNPITFYHVVIKKMIPWLKAETRVLRGVTTKGAEGNGGSTLSLMMPKRLIDKID